jgi:hypothetical protein
VTERGPGRGRLITVSTDYRLPINRYLLRRVEGRRRRRRKKNSAAGSIREERTTAGRGDEEEGIRRLGASGNPRILGGIV